MLQNMEIKFEARYFTISFGVHNSPDTERTKVYMYKHRSCYQFRFTSSTRRRSPCRNLRPYRSEVTPEGRNGTKGLLAQAACPPRRALNGQQTRLDIFEQANYCPRPWHPPPSRLKIDRLDTSCTPNVPRLSKTCEIEKKGGSTRDAFEFP